jgi:ParB family chromosome partitioning protein
MAKLTDGIKISGMNSGAQVLGKMMRVSEIEEDPEISNMFQVHEDVFQAILESMREKGYDQAEPLVIWKGKKIVVDGRTRLRAARAAELTEVPVVEREFETLNDAKFYCYKRQADRRNLTQAEIFTVAAELGLKVNRDGNGRGAESLAKELGVSQSVIEKARTVAKHAPEEDIEAVKNNEMSINKAYERLRQSKKPEEEVSEEDPQNSEDMAAEEEAAEDIETGDILDSAIESEETVDDSGEEPGIEFHANDANGLPGNVKFLKSSVILLIDSQESTAAKLLIDHFLREKEKIGFYKLLPENIREGISK